MSIEMKDVITDEMILKERMREFERARAIRMQALGKEYPVKWEDAIRKKTCIGCGSAVQPCCGH